MALRAVTNVLLRDLNVSLIAEQMSRGAPVIYCDFVDYDEVAHHAGPLRPESMQTLEGLDRVLGTLDRLAANAARRYEIVVLSDHGQSQGATFRQRYGETLEEVVATLVNTPVTARHEPPTAGPPTRTGAASTCCSAAWRARAAPGRRPCAPASGRAGAPGGPDAPGGHRRRRTPSSPSPPATSR